MAYVTDTHAVVWHLTGDSRLGAKARRIFEAADAGTEVIHVPCIVLFELLYLSEKGKVPMDVPEFAARLKSSANYRVEPMCSPVIEASRHISRTAVRDPWDRLIAATSAHLGLPLITRDRTLRALNLTTVW